MSILTCSCSSKTYIKLFAPIRGLVMHMFLLLLITFVKYCTLALIIFAIGNLILHLWNSSNKGQKSVEGSLQVERLSASMIENGSFSKYPHVVEFLTSDSVESIKRNLKK